MARFKDNTRDLTSRTIAPEQFKFMSEYNDRKASEVFAKLEAEKHSLITNRLGFPIKRNTRVRVLDISGHYAKIRFLEGEMNGAECFVTPDRIKVK